MSVADVVGVVAVLDVRQSPQSTDVKPFLLGGAAVGRLARVWPPSPHFGVSWPPPLEMTAEQFQDLADSLTRVASPDPS